MSWEKPSQPAVPPADDAAKTPDAEAPESRGTVSDIKNMIGNHKGKLAVGAAAMLGLAIFYKWRETNLAKEDPEEFARLQRLKAAVGGSPADPDEFSPQDES
jgi:hypothetical protein